MATLMNWGIDLSSYEPSTFEWHLPGRPARRCLLGGVMVVVVVAVFVASASGPGTVGREEKQERDREKEKRPGAPGHPRSLHRSTSDRQSTLRGGRPLALTRAPSQRG